MYVLIIESGAPPQLAAKYEGDHRPDLRLLSKHSARDALETIDELRNGNIGRIVHQQVNMIALTVHFNQFCIEVLADALEDVFEESKLIC